MTHLDMAGGPEFDRIRAIARALGSGAAPIGDDCALIPFGGEFLALSTDLTVEDVHFRRQWLTLDEIGWRAAASALSDLAAEAAEPIGLLAALSLPAGTDDAAAAAIMTGMGAAAQSVGAEVLGGDLSRGPSLGIAATVVGRTRRPVTRAGAEPGDGVWVTGQLGGAGAALQSLQRGESLTPEQHRFFARPEPRVAAGIWLAEYGARAMLDLSDGIAADAPHLAAASKVAISIHLELLPCADAVCQAGDRIGVAPEQFAAEGGEDYELLAAMPPSFTIEHADQFTAVHGLPLTRIGEVAQGAAGATFLLHGAPIRLSGFDHFA
ncbi:MAG TPA: thiamine-phosphate kinase [Gemmatimonadales bacterium]|nr:thiamine-phosphate kinase [Gemmatimonadales bacterium]